MREINVAPDKASPEESPFSKSKVPFTDAEDESHIIGPTSSLDIRLIAEYLANSAPGKIAPLWFTRSIHDHPMAGQQQPVTFGAVHRRPLGTSPSQTIASSKCEIIEKLLDPSCIDLINLYFAKINTCFPILDGPEARRQLINRPETFSPALRACLLAHTMVFWKQSRKRSGQHYPDVRFVWKQANEALYSELYLSPGMSTLSAILLNIAGRPLTSMIGNGILLGSAISLAHSLGLHHECGKEVIPPAEKRTRLRMWWTIVVLDRWSSVAYGKPPQLRRNQYNVRSPGQGDLMEHPLAFPETLMSVAFPALVTLTEVLDTYLEYVFNLRGALENPRVIEKPDLDRQLRAWEDSLPHRLRHAILRGDDLRIPSSPNLRLAYLYIKFLSRKMEAVGNSQRRNPDATVTDALSQDSPQQDTPQQDIPQQDSPQQDSPQPVLKAAQDILHFLQDLDERDLADFWLSPIAFTLSDTVSFLLGCAMGRENDWSTRIKSSLPFQLAEAMISALQYHQTRCGWDIGAVCLAQHAKTVEQIMALDAGGPASEMPHLEGGADGITFSNVDEPLPDLWEWFEGI